MGNHVRKIVLEEHYSHPSLAEYVGDLAEIIEAQHMSFYKSRLLDLEDVRIREMDKNGVDVSVLSVTTPGVQVERNRDVAVKKARDVNDYLAGVIARHPTRLSGFCHPKEAANELERGVTQLGLRGALINGHTNGEYLDDEKFWVVWERAEALGVPIYLHPANSPVLAPSIQGYPEMRGPEWEWGPETAGHALRIIYGGVFDRFPKATLILGHMGEALPVRFIEQAPISQMDREKICHLNAARILKM